MNQVSLTLGRSCTSIDLTLLKLNLISEIYFHITSNTP